MATVTHYIYSHYDPEEQQRRSEANGGTAGGETDPCQTEHPFGARRAPAPGFVKAAVSYEQVNDIMGAPQSRSAPSNSAEGTPPGNDVAGWYRSLIMDRPRTPNPPPNPEPVASGSNTTLEATRVPPESPQPKRYKNRTWFAPHIRRPPVDAPPTIADILEREPPPSSGDKPFTLPVYIAISPSNRGYAMLQKSGWSEGETLGAHVVRKADKLANTREPEILLEEVELDYDDDGEITELRTIEIVDLTGSDDEEVLEPPSSPAGTALLTPLPTVLKLDRLGIGLKAKTVGPYKASKKRVTHNQAALAAHIRANEEMRKLKKLMGRGARAFARQAKAEEEQRKQLLASLKSP